MGQCKKLQFRQTSDEVCSVQAAYVHFTCGLCPAAHFVKHAAVSSRGVGWCKVLNSSSICSFHVRLVSCSTFCEARCYEWYRLGLVQGAHPRCTNPTRQTTGKQWKSTLHQFKPVLLMREKALRYFILHTKAAPFP